MVQFSPRPGKPPTRPPPSGKSVQTKKDTVNEICTTIKRYAQKYLSQKEINYDTCEKTFKDVSNQWKIDHSEFQSWKDFLEQVEKSSVDRKIKTSEPFKDLINICERSKEFEVMIPVIRERIVTCVKEHVYKYCHSFAEETGGVDARVVVDYEQQIRNYKKDIEKMIDAINADILRYSDVKSSFEKFVKEGKNIAKLMESICVQIVEIALEVKKWISDDAVYPDKLQQEILFNNGYKETLQEDVNKLHERRKSLERSLERRGKLNRKLEKDYHFHRKEKKKRKHSIHTLQMKIEKLEFQIAQKSESVEGTKTALSTRRTLSPRQEEEMHMKLARHLKEMKRIEEWLDVAKRQKARNEKELKEISDRTYELKVELVTNRHEAEEMANSLEGMNIELKGMHERLESLDRKTAVMKHIRVLKMSPETLRKLYRRRREFYQQGQLMEACQYVAQEIASEWKRLYEVLPFEPRRDPEKLFHDIELIDIISARRDKTYEEQALKSLEKWRTFSRRHADVAQLIRGLRKLNKEELADNVENRFSMESVYG
ncbi:coiled-coil domain-containing protein 18-like [Ruditapes philippinarum]|uniref:coiled-coil domain-containing protein 18-like n=1 Tax=Ruditapes philippinarum TaxID=129788 RepID=UPI00295A7D37|nr:coiled-coil domain-containing protein 18-like [Ruditapes philippinarum]